MEPAATLPVVPIVNDIFPGISIPVDVLSGRLFISVLFTLVVSSDSRLCTHILESLI